jgi:hypothetical protein
MLAMTRVAQRSTALFSLAFILLAIPFALKFVATLPLLAAANSQSSPGGAAAAVAVDVALLRADLDAKSLAAAGLNANQVSALVAATSAHFVQHPDALRSADQAYAQARFAHDALERKVGSGLASSGEVAELASARQALTAARALRASALQAIHTAATASLNGIQRSKLATLRANAGKPGPIEFKTVERTEADWLSLRKALANERVSAQCGDQPHAGCQTLLSTTRSNASVAAAKSACDTHLASIKSAWSSAVGG